MVECRSSAHTHIAMLRNLCGIEVWVTRGWYTEFGAGASPIAGADMAAFVLRNMVSRCQKQFTTKAFAGVQEWKVLVVLRKEFCEKNVCDC